MEGKELVKQSRRMVDFRWATYKETRKEAYNKFMDIIEHGDSEEIGLLIGRIVGHMDGQTLVKLLNTHF